MRFPSTNGLGELESRVSEYLRDAGEPVFTKWRWCCPCGFVSAFAYSQRVALETGLHHRRLHHPI